MKTYKEDAYMQYMWHTLYTLHWDLLWEEYTKNIRGNTRTYSFCIFTNWHHPPSPLPQDLGLVGCDSWNTWVCMFWGNNSKCKTQLSWILLTAIHILCMITHGSFVWEVGLLVLMVFAWLHNLHIYIFCISGTSSDCHGKFKQDTDNFKLLYMYNRNYKL